MVYEDVPHVSRRSGDSLLAGQNNSTIILGRDRVESVDSGYGSLSNNGGKDAGAMHLVVGRKSTDPSVLKDSATLYLSSKSDPDEQADTSSVGKVMKSVSAAVMRADCVRIVPREDFKLSVGKSYITMTSDGKVVIDGDVQLGKDASERIIRGEAFAAVWASHVHPTAVGPSGPPQPLPQSVFSPRNKVG
jgi:hypothetical protein